MKQFVIFIALLVTISYATAQLPKRCPKEWSGVIILPGKTKDQIYKMAINWGMMRTGVSEPNYSNADQGLFKSRTKLPYMYRGKSYRMLYDLNLLAEEGKLNYSMVNCYIKAKPLMFWLEKYPYPDNLFDDTFESIYNNMSDVIKDLSYTFQRP